MSKKLVITKLNLPDIAPADIAILFENDIAEKVDIFYENEPFVVGNIYVAHVNDVVKNINAAFVEYDIGKKAYLSMDNATNVFFINKKNTTKICEGDNILIQIKKEPIKTKDAVCSTTIEFPSKYAVLTYGKPGINVSTKIKNDKIRETLITECNIALSQLEYNKDLYGMITPELYEEIISNTGIILRTEAKDIDNFEILKNDVLTLFNELFICINKAIYSKGRTRIKEVDNPIISLCKQYHTDTLITDNRFYYDLLKKEHMHISFYEDPLLPLYKLYSIETLLSEIKSRKIWLKSGAYLIIDYTEAMTVIDVNTGKCEKGKNKADTILKINLEAAVEAMHQLRLRNISGIIIIDFIDMNDNNHKEQLINQLKQEAMKDSIKTSIMGMTRLNLVEITRMKIRERITIK